MPHIPRTTVALAVLAGAAALALADSTKGTAMIATASTTAGTMPAQAVIEAHMPSGYRAASRRPVTVDGSRAELLRHERADGRNAGSGGEHFSALVAGDGRLTGFARMDIDLAGRALPAPEDAQAIALEFLRRAAPDLLATLEIHWVAQHDEALAVSTGGHAQNLTLSAIKVKMRNRADGRWMWVIVGADRKPMVFERDIVWLNMPGQRQTEKWLHDAWLAERDGAVQAR